MTYKKPTPEEVVDTSNTPPLYRRQHPKRSCISCSVWDSKWGYVVRPTTQYFKKDTHQFVEKHHMFIEEAQALMECINNCIEWCELHAAEHEARFAPAIDMTGDTDLDEDVPFEP